MPHLFNMMTLGLHIDLSWQWTEETLKICHSGYNAIESKSVDECKALCLETSGCSTNGFSYVPAWNQCRMPGADQPCTAGSYSQGAFYTASAGTTCFA